MGETTLIRIDYVNAKAAILDLNRLGVVKFSISHVGNGEWEYKHEGIRYVFLTGDRAYKEIPCTE